MQPYATNQFHLKNDMVIVLIIFKDIMMDYVMLRLTDSPKCFIGCGVEMYTITGHLLAQRQNESSKVYWDKEKRERFTHLKKCLIAHSVLNSI